MKNDSTIDLYRKYYGDFEFERVGLFKFISENYACGEVLYPGCFIHITPSFYFPHVVYVDKDPVAVDFFTNQVDILQFVNRKKKYKRSAYIQLPIMRNWLYTRRRTSSALQIRSEISQPMASQGLVTFKSLSKWTVRHLT